MKSRNFNLVAASVAAALAVGSASAAVDPNTATIKLVAAGSSAARDAFLVVMSSEMCNGDLTVYRASSGNSPDMRVYSCTLVPNSNVAGSIGDTLRTNGNIGGNTIALSYRAEGGSVWGPLAIVARQQNAGFSGIKALDTAAAGCAAAPVNTTFTVGTFSAVIPTVNCGITGTYSLADDGAGVTAGLVDKQVQFGVSDVESKMFTGFNYPESSKFPAETDAIKSGLKNLANSSGFGQSFGIVVNTANPLTSVTPQQVTAILSGNYTNWSKLGWVAGPDITVARREPGSGTQASAAAHFLHQNCGDSLSFVTSDDGVTQQFSTTGGVVGYVAANTNAVGISAYAEGGSGNPAGTKFLQINGVSGNRENVANGTYGEAFELTTQKSPVAAVLTGTSLNLANSLQAILKRVGTSPDVPNVFAIPSGTNPPGSHSGSRVVANGSRLGNSCVPFQGQ